MSGAGRGAQSGQTLVVFALMMVFVFLALMALVGDADVLMFQYDQATSAALIGAQAGASDIDLQALYTGNVRQLASDAGTRCQDAALQGQSGSVTVTCNVTLPDLVTATVTRQAQLPIPLFGPSAQVRAVRSARSVFGGVTPQ